MFADPGLSSSGHVSCATCHDPTAALASSTAAPVAVAGFDLAQAGHRAVPSLKYLQAVPAFSEHYFDEDEDGSVDNGPAGGLTWDGRVDRHRDQAALPLLSPFEMANASPEALRARIVASSYASEFSRLFGPSALENAGTTVADIGLALEVYQQEEQVFYPYSSKYDAVLKGRAALSLSEQRGLALFEASEKGNCARCHPDRPDVRGQPPQFTDYGFVAIGVPRNSQIPADGNASFFDLGLCGPDRRDLTGRQPYCGRFMTPTLRNVATRRVFFHNGVATTLRRAVEFYVERDTRPDRWYPASSDGTVMVFNDLPHRYWANVETDPPFGRKKDGSPRLSAAEIDDLIAFLATLTDGFITRPSSFFRPPWP